MKKTAELIEVGRGALFQNYRQPDFVLAEGFGSRVRDVEGNEYIDLIAGIASSVVGHCHPKVSGALQIQADRLWHMSNLYWSDTNIRLAQRLVASCFADRVFFCNSGAEANEAAIKLARRYHYDRGSDRRTILTFEGAFHGRTYGALAATGKPAYFEGFDPIPGGFRQLPYGDIEALEAAMTDDVAAVMLEVIQGENGVVPAPPGYLDQVRSACDKAGALLILDEVQSGMGRTGKMWGYQWSEVEPDIMSSAKSLANGFPMGALFARDEIAASFVPGTHATTFGGNPLASAVGLAVLEVLLDDGGLELGIRQARKLWEGLETRLVGRGPVKGIRGRGMWVGLLVDGAAGLKDTAQEAGVLVNALGDGVIRLAPSLVISDEEIDEALTKLEEAWL